MCENINLRWHSQIIIAALTTPHVVSSTWCRCPRKRLRREHRDDCQFWGVRVSEWVHAWVSEEVSGWAREWMVCEWVSEWVSARVSAWASELNWIHAMAGSLVDNCVRVCMRARVERESEWVYGHAITILGWYLRRNKTLADQWYSCRVLSMSNIVVSYRIGRVDTVVCVGITISITVIVRGVLLPSLMSV